MKFGERITLFWNRHRAAIISFLLNLAICVLVVSVTDFCFETNDDRDISNLLADVYGTGMGTYIPFINIIFCEALSFLFRLLGTTCNWYAVLLIALGFLSLVTICRLLLYRAEKILFGFLLSLLFLVTIYADYYIQFQFTHYAILCCSAGCLGLADSFYEGEKPRPGQALISVFLLMAGSMIRFQAVLFTLPGLGIVMLRQIFGQNGGTPAADKIRAKRRQLTAVFAAACVIAGARGFHLYVYAADQMLREFHACNKLRVELLDYGLPDYEENREEFAALGIAEADMECLDAQIFLDREVFSTEVFEELADRKEQSSSVLQLQNFSVEGLRKVFAYIRTDFFAHPHWNTVFMILVVYLLCARKENLPEIAAETVFAAACIWYFLSVDRMPYRVWCSVITPLLVFGFYFLARDYRGINGGEGAVLPKMFRYYGVFYLLFVCLIQTGRMGADLPQRPAGRATDNYEAVISFAEEHPDALVLVDRPTVSPLTYYSTVGVLEVPERGSHRNICYQGGWICRTPANLSVLEQYEEKNPYKAIAKGETVYLVDARSADKVLDFIRRHYDADAEARQEACIGESRIPVYRFYGGQRKE